MSKNKLFGETLDIKAQLNKILNTESYNYFNYSKNRYFFSGFSNNLKQRNHHLKKIISIRRIIFNELCILLNSNFNVNFKKNFWEILIGPWYNFALEAFYNRYYSLTNKSKKKLLKKIIFKNVNNNAFKTTNTSDFIKKIDDLDWNVKVFLEISKIKKYNYIILNNNKYDEYSFENKNRLNVKQVIKKKINKILFLLIHFNDKLIVNTGLTKKDEINLQIKLKQFPILNIPDFLENLQLPIKYDKNLRNFLEIKFKKKKDNLLTLTLKRLLIKNIPTIYLENFLFISKKTLNYSIIKKTKKILTSQNFDENEYFKFFAAYSSNFNTKIYYIQHGNTDGTNKYDIYYNPITSASKFLTWGWNRDDISNNYPEIKKKIISFCNLKLSCYKKFSKIYQFQNQLVFFGAPLLKRRHFWDVDADNSKLLKNQFNILKSLRKDIQCKTIYKIHSDEIKKKIFIKKTINKINSEIQFASKFIKISDYKNILSVFSYDSSGFYEHICLNKPCLVLIPNYQSNLNFFAKKLYKSLEDCMIIHQNVNSISKFINNNWNNISDWWYSKNNQDKIIKFSQKLCKHEKNYFKKIKLFLND